jgi:hypothetical protein
MARDLTNDMKTEVAAEALRPVFIIKLEYTDGDLNLWTGYGPLVWNGETYTGTGTLLGIEPIEEASAMRSVGTSLTLTGVSEALRALALQAAENIEDGEATIWLGCLWESGEGMKELVYSPYQIFKGRMDVPSLVANGTATVIRQSVEGILADLERPKRRNYTPEDQKVDYPTDTFFDFVAVLQNKQITWGRA